MLGSAAAVVQVEGGYRLDVADGDVDALRFDRLAADGRDRLRAGDPRAAVALLGEAVALWPGHPGAEPAAIAAVAPPIAIRLARLSVEAVTDLAEAELALGRAASATARLTALQAEQPMDERAAALLMDALAAQGRQAEALALYERVRETLADRLGADPGTALRDRHLGLLRSPTAQEQTGARMPTDISPSTQADSGASTPELAGSGAGNAPPGNLPAPLTSFVGRDDDLARIDALLAAGRLVTVTGPGGAGKTRLALEAARRCHHEYRDGTWLVDLSSVTEPSKAGAALLAAIGLRGATLFVENPGPDRSELDLLTDELAGRDCLLLVDNCEHLVDAIARLIAALLPRCAGLRVLATSREPLALDGEALVPLGPLALPEPDDDLEQARRRASVRLFLERASAVRPGFDVDDDVVKVVRGLDGMPLALELAAARLRTLSLAELADGLSDRFRLLTTGSRTASSRHRTLRAVIAWSWDLLGDDERTVADRISVLPGGVTPASAAAVCEGTGVPPAGVPELLAALVDRSLLQLAPEAGRYRMLETLREYGIDRLTAEGTLHAVRDLAARHVSAVVAVQDPLLRGPGQLAALRVIRAEYDNALAALRHRCDSGDGAGAVELARDLIWYWQMFGRHTDATYWLGEALALPVVEHTLDRDCVEAVLTLSRVRSRPAAGAGEGALRALTERLLAYPSLPGLAGALTAMALAFLDEEDAAVAVVQGLVDGPDVWLSALAHMFRAQFAENEGDLDQVRVDVEAALDGFGRAGDRWGMAAALPMRAQLRQYDGDLDGALADLGRARELAREFGSLSLGDELFIDLRWVDLYLRRGDTERALAMVAAARERTLRSASPEMLVLVDALEGGVWLRLGDVDRAAELIGEAEVGLARDFPFGDHGQAIVSSIRAWLCVERGDAAGAEVALVRAYGAAVTSRDMPLLSMVAVTAAGLAELRGRYRDVALLLGSAARLRGAHDRTDPQIRAMIGRGGQALGESDFAEAYEIGWKQDGTAALARVDPGRPRREALPAAGSAS